MTPNVDIRWQQRLDNYQRALRQLQSAVTLSQTRALSELEQQGMVQAFEFTHELAWKVMKDYFAYQGRTGIKGSRDATSLAIEFNLLNDGDCWLEMIESRNQSVHTFDCSVAERIAGRICTSYTALLVAFAGRMQQLRANSAGQRLAT